MRNATVVEYNRATVRTVYRSLFGNSLIAVAKTCVFLKSGSSAMLSEAVHSFADIGNQVCLIIGLKQSQVNTVLLSFFAVLLSQLSLPLHGCHFNSVFVWVLDVCVSVETP